MNQAKDNFDKDKSSVSDGDGNTHSNFAAFEKEVALNKANAAKRKAAEDAIPLEVRQAKERKEQRHLAKLKKEKKLEAKATKLATE